MCGSIHRKNSHEPVTLSASCAYAAMADDRAHQMAMGPAWPEDDIKMLGMSSHDRWHNCCHHIASCLRWRGLRESDLDALQRRQKAAEWSNVFAEGEWGSDSGAYTGSQTSDPLGEIELVEVDDWSGDAHASAALDGLTPHPPSSPRGPDAMQQSAGIAPAPPAFSPAQPQPQPQPDDDSDRLIAGERA